MQNFFLLIITFVILSNLAYSQFSGGEGTKNNPYKITSKKDMETLSDSIYKDYNWTIEKYFKLMNDITDSVKTMIPYFKGNFDGNNNKITIDLDFIGSGIALFQNLTNAMIYDLSVDGYVKGYEYIAGIASSIENSNITNCINYAKIESAGSSGGIVGFIHWKGNSNITNCTNYGKIEGKGWNFGGIAGFVWENTNIINCTNYGDIVANITVSTGIGGIVGVVEMTKTRGVIFNNKNYGNVIGYEAVGGIAGCLNVLFCDSNSSVKNNILSNCVNSGNVTGVMSVGGIVGHLHHFEKILHCVNIGTITGDCCVGGIAGGDFDIFYNYENNTISCGFGDILYCINAGLVIGRNGVGGIIGVTGLNGVVKHCINTGVVLPSSNDVNNIGAIIGVILLPKGVVIENCYYDKQMCIYGGINNNDIVKKAEGYLTEELIGNNLLSKLGIDNWIYYDSLYPILKDLEYETISKVAALPAYLDDINKDYDRHNNIRQCFFINLKNDVIWTNAFDKLEFLDNKVYLANKGEDTLYIGIGNVKKTIPVMINDICDGRWNTLTKFTILADTHLLVDPRATDYPLPIYITADRNIWRYSNFIIDLLVIEIDKYIFYLKKVDNGFVENYNDGLILLKNIKIPELKANEPTLLLNFIGDMLLHTDSGNILLKNVIFDEDLAEKSDLKNGYITLDVCKEGSDRLLSSGNIPTIIIIDNPLTNILKTEIKVLDVGNYSLEIVDILGKTEIVKEWFVSKDDAKEFFFEIPTIMYGNGSYFLVLNTPTEKYLEKFIIKR